jgi:hypothetical protein
MTQLPPQVDEQPLPPGAVWATRERPSYTPTVLVTIFFGIFGLIPAFRHSRMARERVRAGLPDPFPEERSGGKRLFHSARCGASSGRVGLSVHRRWAS